VKLEYVLVAVVTACLTVMSVTPALAAPRQIEEFCFEQARRYVTGDPYRRGAWEAAIANCKLMMPIQLVVCRLIGTPK